MDDNDSTPPLGPLDLIVTVVLAGLVVWGAILILYALAAPSQNII